MSRNAGVVVVGGGQAAVQFVGALRSGGYTDNVLMLCGEESLPYSRPPLSKGFLKGEVTADSLLIRKPDYYSQIDVDVRVGCIATRIDPLRRIIFGQSGEQFEYELAVLATGGRPRTFAAIPPELHRVHYLRTVNDARALQEALHDHQKVLIIGGGYLGLEAAASLAGLGHRVTVVEMQPRLLAHNVAADLSDHIARIHERRGCEIRCGLGISAISGDQRGLTVVTTADEQIDVDVLLVCVGMEPNTELAAAAGLECDGGVLVDANCRTSNPSIFAIGDVARRAHVEGRSLRIESVDNAIQMARAAAAAITRTAEPEETAPIFWSDQYDTKLQMVGIPPSGAECVIRRDISSGDRMSALFVSEGRLVAAHCLNAAGDFINAKRLIAGRHRVTVSELADPSIRLRAL